MTMRTNKVWNSQGKGIEPEDSTGGGTHSNGLVRLFSGQGKSKAEDDSCPWQQHISGGVGVEEGEEKAQGGVIKPSVLLAA